MYWIIQTGFVLCLLNVTEHAFCQHFEGVKEYCTGDMFKPTCPEGQVVLMQRALYGRMSTGGCIGHNENNIGCSADVISVADDECTGRQSCEVIITNGDMDSLTTCDTSLRVYLEASYICIRVLQSENSRCDGAHQVSVSTTNKGYLSSSVSTANSCGVGHNPLVLLAEKGKTFKITLVDLNPTFNGINESQTCRRLYGYLEDGGHRSLICSVRSRISTVLEQSKSHTIKIWFDRNAIATYNYFIEYQVTGCADLIPPENAWVDRHGNKTTVGCYASKSTWHLQCINNKWHGVIGNCSLYVPAEKSLTQKQQNPLRIATGAVIALVTCSAVVVSAAIVITGMVCIKRDTVSQQQQYLSRSRLSSEASSKYVIKETYGSMPQSRSSLGYQTASEYTPSQNNSYRLAKPRGKSVGDNADVYFGGSLGDNRERVLGGSSMMSVQTYDSGVSVFFNADQTVIPQQLSGNEKSDAV